MPAVGDPIFYRSQACGIWQAQITAVRHDSPMLGCLIDIEVLVPQTSKRVSLSRIKFGTEKSPNVQAWPRVLE